ncbi:hypothetical protein LSAT2_021575 [Lamellibrachia satsuma]|nr:hypothetical protein LSAT2_021575 [Lamellibrachia satsuma]
MKPSVGLNATSSHLFLCRIIWEYKCINLNVYEPAMKLEKNVNNNRGTRRQYDKGFGSSRWCNQCSLQSVSPGGQRSLLHRRISFHHCCGSARPATFVDVMSVSAIIPAASACCQQFITGQT